MPVIGPLTGMMFCKLRAASTMMRSTPPGAPAGMTGDFSFVVIDGVSVEVYTAAADGPDRRPLVMLHEGLGCVALWRDLPDRLAAATGRKVIAYSRHGYGQSSPFTAPLTPRYMHDQALGVLPKLLQHLDLSQTILLGHSDGASIALIHAAGNAAITGLILEAPHVFVENISIRGIARARHLFDHTDLHQKLARYHRDPAGSFFGWNDIWLDPGFRDWDITDVLPQISCPVLAIQGRDDEYGSLAQIDAIGAAVTGPFEQLIMADCGHSPHRDQEAQTVQAMLAFLHDLP